MRFDKTKTRKNNLFIETVNETRFVESKISSLTGSKIQILKYKFKVVGKTSEFQIVSKVAQVLEGQQVDNENLSVK